MKQRILAAGAGLPAAGRLRPDAGVHGGRRGERSGGGFMWPLDDRPWTMWSVWSDLGEVFWDMTCRCPRRTITAPACRDSPSTKRHPVRGRADLYEWVLAQEESGCDRYILSMDQLLSGGLVNSRSMWEHEAVTLSDGTTLTEPELLSSLLETLARDENNQVWLLDSVMRLAPTVGYDHWDLDGYNALPLLRHGGKARAGGEGTDGGEHRSGLPPGKRRYGAVSG